MTERAAQSARENGPTAKAVDMSPEAVWARLRRVDELNDLCQWLSEFKRCEKPSENALGTERDS